MLRNYFRTAWRNLWHNKIYAFINIFGLSIGLTCCMLIFLYTKDEVSFDRFHERGSRIYRITTTGKEPDGSVNKFAATGMMPGPTFKRNIPEIEDYLRIQGTTYT